MILRAKILLLWLLTLAIPVQGFAAVLQAGCAPVKQAAAPAGTHAWHETAAMPAMQDMHAMHTMHAVQDMDHDMRMAGADHGPSHDSSHHTSHKPGSSCSSCATCNVGAMLPLALAAPPTPDLPSPRYLAQPPAGFVGFTPENPDRPPALA